MIIILKGIIYILFCFFPLLAFKLYLSAEPDQIFLLEYYSYFFYGLLFVQFLFFYIGAYVANKIGKKKEKDNNINKIEVSAKWANYSLKKKIFISILLLITFVLFSNFFQQLGVDSGNIKKEQPTTSFFFVLGLPLSLLIAGLSGLFEEKILREYLQGKILQPKFKGRYTKFLPIFISSFLFSLLHFQGNYNYLIFLLGLFLGFIYFYYKSIKLNIFIHSINNILGILLLFNSGVIVQNYENVGPAFQEKIGILSKTNYITTKIQGKKDDSLLYSDILLPYILTSSQKDISKNKYQYLEDKYESYKKEATTGLDKKIIKKIEIYLNIIKTNIKKDKI